MSSPQIQLKELCRKIGAQVPLWTQGAGGNISLKQGKDLWIKASGFRLDQVEPNRGIACVDLARLLESLENLTCSSGDPEALYSNAIAQSMKGGSGLGRPSMETGFHALLEKKWVFHFHSLVALLISHEHANSPIEVESWFRQVTSLNLSFLPPERPGWLLSKAIAPYKSFDIFVLQNHGVILQSDDEDILSEWRELEKKFCDKWGYTMLHAVAQNTAIPMRIYFPDTAVFLDRLKQVLEPENGTSQRWKLSSMAWTQDRDAAELWLGTSILYENCPTLAEVPESIASVVGMLPTELIRKRQGQQKP